MAIANELTITSASALDMANTMFGDGIQIVSATYSGDAASSGIYSGAATTIPGIVPGDSGVILSTGNTGDFTDSTGTADTNPGSSQGTDMVGGVDGDAQLNAAAGLPTFDAAIFEASFIPTGDYLTMQFVFSSEEYLEYVGQSYNDVVGVWVNGAFVPLTITFGGVVSIDGVNTTQNSNLYVDNPAASDLYNTQMDGFTVTLSLKAPVVVGQTNTIKIGIADGGDGAFDSNLLIVGDSIQTIALAMEDKLTVLPNSSRTFDILANDNDLNDTGLTITQINGQDIVVGEIVTLGTGEQIRLNADGTITVFSDGDLGSNTLTYTITDGVGNTDVGYVTITTASAIGPDGIVEGSAASDVIDAAYLGDPDGDRIDNNDALGVGGTTGDGDYILAGAGNDSIVAGAGNDVIYAGADNDTVFGGDGNDWVSLGSGNDSFGTFNADSAGNDTVYGDAGNDYILTGGQDDQVFGGIGDDTLSGGVASDTLYGGDGNDVFMVADDHDYDSVDGGLGTDTFAAGNFTSTSGIAVTFNGTGAGTYDYLGTTAAGDFSNIEVISGTAYADALNAAADAGGVVLQGEGGNDSLTGGSGADTLDGGADNDSVAGGGGNDSLNAGSGDDTVLGDDGNDTLQGLEGMDLLSGGAGADSLFGWDGNDTLYGGADADMVDGDAGDDLLFGDAGDDTLIGDDGNDTLFGGTGNDQIYDSAGADVVDAGDGNDQVFVGEGDDSVVGGAGADSLYGGTGADTLTGGLENDLLDGGYDRDVFYGGSGDVVDGGEGGDDLDTLNVTDVFSIIYDPVNGENGTITFIDNSTMVFSNIEQVVVNGVPYEPVDGTSGADFMDIGYTDAQGDQIDGTDGNNDTIYGYAGGDTIYGGAGDDIVLGGIGNDEIAGGTGNDSLVGETGNDTLTGAAGIDTLLGGDDADLLVASAGDTAYGGEGGTDSDTLAASDVIGISYDGANAENGTLTFSDGSTANFFDIEQVVLNGGNLDGIVYGTTAADYIGAGYVDNNGDIIDAGDAIYAGAGPDDDDVFAGDGNDTILSGAGVDNVYAGTGADLVYTGDGNDYGQGNEDNDTLYGGAGDDFLRGDAGNDSVFGGIGNDTNYGGLGEDIVDTGDGDDFAYGGYGNDTVFGGIGNDTLTGSDGFDQVYGGSGDDLINGSTGADTLYGGDGLDLLFGDEDADVIYGGIGDQVDGGETGLIDNDTLHVADVASVTWDAFNSENGTITFNGGGTLVFVGIENLFVDGVLTTRPDGTVSGTAGDDMIDVAYVGDPDGDLIDANDASLSGAAPNDDLVLAGAGNDDVVSGLGNDVVYGGIGDDTLNGGVGNDQLLGEDGSDLLIGEDGDDTLYGGAGIDRLHGGAGNDSLAGGEGDDLLTGGSGNDTILGEGGDDSIALEIDFGNATITGGETGEVIGDVLDLSPLSGTATIDLSGADPESGTITNGTSTVVYSEIELVSLGDETDTLILADGSGNDTVRYFTSPIDNGDGTYSGVDQLNVSGLTNGAGSPVTTADVVVSDDGNGNAVLTFPGGESLTLIGTSPAMVQSQAQLEAMGIPVTAVDYIVEGTAGNDVIDGSYLGDPEGDRIDAGDNLAGNDGDVVQAGAGDDAVYAGLGADLVYAGDGLDYLDGGDGNDTLYGEAGADGLTGGLGDDLLDGGAGNDAFDGGDGADTLYGGLDNDDVRGSAGNDLLYGDAGNDRVLGGTGTDVLFGGDGVDTLEGQDGNDTISGGMAIDQIYGGTGDDSLSGDEGDDDLFGGAGFDSLYGGLGNDWLRSGENASTLYGGDGNDQIQALTGGITAFGDTGNDSIFGGIGNDSISGGADNDWLWGDAGNDTINGDAGDDVMWGWYGNDTLIGGDGADIMDGGDDRDTFFAGVGDAVTGGEGGDDYDTLNLVGYGKDNTNIFYGGGNNESGYVEFLDATGTVVDTMLFQEIEQVVPCFTPGILIETERGAVKVEDLAAGDRVWTRDHGLQPIRWVGQRRMTRFDLIDQPKLNPIRIRAGALGHALPQRDMLVSPQHRMLMSGARAEMFFGESEVLVAATHLVGESGVERVYPNGVTYIHFMFDQHQIIQADGTWTESFQPGDRTLAGMDSGQREELFAIFPELEEIGADYPAARPTLKAHEARVLMSR